MINISISTNVLIILSCVILLIIIGFIAYIIYKDKRNDQAEIDELIDDIVKAKPREEVQVTKIESTTQPTSQSAINLEEMLITMQNDLEKKETNKIENFEQDQESNAIISYKELLKAADKVENYEKEQEDNAIISYKELTSLNKLEEKEELMKAPVKKAIAKIESPREKKDKKFKNTDFISPIFGKMDEHIEYPKIKAVNKEDDLSLNSYFGEDIEEKYDKHLLEKALNVESLNDEVKRNTDFLNALKEFRNNL